jgi:hypothetical protein
MTAVLDHVARGLAHTNHAQPKKEIIVRICFVNEENDNFLHLRLIVLPYSKGII